MVIDPDVIMVQIHSYFGDNNNKINGLYKWYKSARMNMRLQMMHSSRFVHELTRLPFYLLIGGDHICPFEAMGKCNLSACFSNKNILHNSQCWLNCHQMHGMMLCNKNKNKQWVRAGNYRGRGRGNFRGRNRGRGRGGRQ